MCCREEESVSVRESASVVGAWSVEGDEEAVEDGECDGEKNDEDDDEDDCDDDDTVEQRQQCHQHDDDDDNDTVEQRQPHHQHDDDDDDDGERHVDIATTVHGPHARPRRLSELRTPDKVKPIPNASSLFVFSPTNRCVHAQCDRARLIQ